MFLFRSFRIFEIFGIPIHIHTTLPILALLVGLGFGLESGTESFTQALGFYALAFGFVLLHELGHCLMASQWGIPTKRITLTPIGGIASLEKLPRNPRIEFLVAIAGPLVNLALAGTFAIFFAFWPGVILFQLMCINLALGLLNLLPGFPMDGGRILRSALAKRFSFLKSTEIAVRVGQVTACGLGVAGVFFHPTLFLIAAFVLFTAQSELSRVRKEEGVDGFDWSGFMNWRNSFSKKDQTDPIEELFETIAKAHEERDRQNAGAPNPFQFRSWTSSFDKVIFEEKPRKEAQSKSESTTQEKERTIEVMPDGSIIDV